VEEILGVTGLTRRYGGRNVVDGLSFGVRKGEIYGFLGKNGAGKSTTIRMILSLVAPTSGEIRLFGESARRPNRALLSRVGSVIEFPGFYGNLTARENLELFACLSGKTKATAVDEALETAGFKPGAAELKSLTRDFSLGMKQRLGIARAIMSHPELLVLDEPMNGLDPAGIREIRDLLVSLARERLVTVFMSSHILSEVALVADRVGIIDSGKLIAESNVADVRGREYVEFGVSDAARCALVLERDFGLSDYAVASAGLVRLYSSTDRIAEINARLVAAGVAVDRIARGGDSLEDYFLSLTGGYNHAETPAL
jgi:bacitracin transport system ATP-binding protein